MFNSRLCACHTHLILNARATTTHAWYGHYMCVCVGVCIRAVSRRDELLGVRAAKHWETARSFVDNPNILWCCKHIGLTLYTHALYADICLSCDVRKVHHHGGHPNIPKNVCQKWLGQTCADRTKGSRCNIHKTDISFTANRFAGCILYVIVHPPHHTCITHFVVVRNSIYMYIYILVYLDGVRAALEFDLAPNVYIKLQHTCAARLRARSLVYRLVLDFIDWCSPRGCGETTLGVSLSTRSKTFAKRTFSKEQQNPPIPIV